MVETVFEPIGMPTAGLGWPATADHPDRPRGHFTEAGALRAQGLDEYSLGSFLVFRVTHMLAYYLDLRAIRGVAFALGFGALCVVFVAALHSVAGRIG